MNTTDELYTKWRTVDTFHVNGEPHAYQQKVSVHKKDRSKKKKKKNYGNSGGVGYGVGVGLGLTLVPTEEHRLVPLHKTLNRRSKERIVGDLDEA